jgi:hypothetical protein
LPNCQIELELGGVRGGGGKEHNFVFSNLWVLLVCRCGHQYYCIHYRFWIQLKPTIMTILVSKHTWQMEEAFVYAYYICPCPNSTNIITQVTVYWVPHEPLVQQIITRILLLLQ